MPEHAVLRLEHPVVLVGEVQELRFHALALQRGEQGDALLHRDAEVLLPVHHQHRHAEFADVVDRIEALVAFRVLPHRAAVLPFAEPQLLGGVAHGAVVEHAIVRDQALPRFVPVAGDPVDHEAAVAGAERAGLVAVEEGVLLLRGLPALLQVLQRTVAPMPADRVGERLAVAGGTVEVDHHHRIALSGIGLRVPAIAPAISEAALRPAVDQECDRVLLSFRVVPGLDHVAVHGVAVPALEAELFVLAPVHVRQHVRGAGRDRALRLAIDAAGEQLVTAVHAVAREHRGRAGDLERGDAAVADQLHGLAGGDVDREQRMLAQVLRRGEDPLAVFGERDAVGGTVPARRDLARLAAIEVHRHQRETVGLEAGPLHRAVIQGLAIGAEHRAGVPRGIGRGEVLRRAAAVGADLVQVEVGRPRLGPVGLARGEDQRPAVGRPGQVGQVAEGLGRDVAQHVAADQRGRLQCACAAQVGDEDAVHAPIGPGVPVADEHVVVDHAAGLALLLRIEPLLGAGQVRLALREAAERQRDAFAVGRKLVAIDVEREVAQLLRGIATHLHRVQLRTAVLGAEEVHGLPVRRERRRVHVPPFRREALRRRRVAGEQVLDPERRARLVRVEVDHALGEHQLAPVRRKRRRGVAVHLRQVAHLEAALGMGERRQCEQEGGGKQGVAQGHGYSGIFGIHENGSRDRGNDVGRRLFPARAPIRRRARGLRRSYRITSGLVRRRPARVSPWRRCDTAASRRPRGRSGPRFRPAAGTRAARSRRRGRKRRSGWR